MAQQTSGALLLGDEGYPLTPYLMTIYRDANTETKKAFNKIHKKERVIIERVFGQLKQRFPILLNRIRVATKRIPDFVAACCVLHNIAKYLKDELYFVIPPQGDQNDEEFELPPRSVLYRRGENRRNIIANELNMRML